MTGTLVTFYSAAEVLARCTQPGESFRSDGRWCLEFNGEPEKPFHSADVRVSLWGTPTELRGFLDELVSALARADLVPDVVEERIADDFAVLDQADAYEADQLAHAEQRRREAAEVDA